MSLARRTAFGFAQFVVALTALLLVPAGTLQFWQAWAYLCVFIGSAGLITVYLWKHDPQLLERRLKAGPGAEKEQGQRWIQLIASLAFIITLVLPALDHRFSWSSVPLFVVVAGDVLVALGFLIIFLVFKENSFAAGTIQVATNQTTISTGPYAIVRHPMYSGALLMLLGTPLALGSWWGLLTFVPMAAAIIWRLLDEEKFLVKNLPGYVQYCRIVRSRLLPYVW